MRIEEFGEKIAEDEVSAFEGRLGLALPGEYRKFLLEFNGGRPVPGDFVFENSRNGSSVRYFFRLRGGERTERLSYAVGVFGERVPHGLLPVARDHFGNLVCIGLVGGGFGSDVVFWDHEREADVGEPPTVDNLIRISSGFDAFLNGLHQSED